LVPFSLEVYVRLVAVQVKVMMIIMQTTIIPTMMITIIDMIIKMVA